METEELQDGDSWFSDSESDDSIVVTISQMQDEAAKLQSSTAEIREELSGLLAALDDIELKAIMERNRKRSDRAKAIKEISADEEVPLTETGTSPSALKPVEEGDEPNDGDDRYRDITAPPPQECREACSGDSATPAVVASKPYDASDILESLLDAVQMERQSGAGDSAEAHRQKPPSAKEDLQDVPKACVVADGHGVAGGVDAEARAGDIDTDDDDVVTNPAASLRERDGSRCRLRSWKPASNGDQSRDALSSSTMDDPYLDAEVVDAPGADTYLVAGHHLPPYKFD